jgi:hypothetical protein
MFKMRPAEGTTVRVLGQGAGDFVNLQLYKCIFCSYRLRSNGGGLQNADASARVVRVL